MFTGTYSGDDIFQKLLIKLGVSMNISEIRMYLLGVIQSPENVPPPFPLEEILLTDTEDEVQFSTQKQAEEFHGLYFGLWNTLVGFDGSSSRTPKLSTEQSIFKSKKEKI